VTDDPLDQIAGRVEVLAETAGTGAAFLAIFGLASLLPGGRIGVIGLPEGFGPVDTPAFGLAVILGAAGAPLLIRRLLGGWSGRHLTGDVRPSWGRAVFHGLVAAAALNLWSRVLLLWQPEIFDPAWSALGIRSMSDVIGAALYVAPLATALPEELLFRGYLQGAVSTRFGAAWGVLLSALVFALFHGYQGGLTVLVAVLPAALVLGLLFRATGSLLAPLIAHAALNAASFTQLGVEAYRPGLAPALITGLSLASAGLLLAGRRQLVAGVVLASRLARDLLDPVRGALALGALGLASVPAWATLVIAFPLAEALPAPGQRLALLFPLLWAAAGLLHRLRRCPLGGDAPRIDASDPGRPAGVASRRETEARMVG
jgi:membrane protease YdiL (CAAX protease family)